MLQPVLRLLAPANAHRRKGQSARRLPRLQAEKAERREVARDPNHAPQRADLARHRRRSAAQPRAQRRQPGGLRPLLRQRWVIAI